MVSPSRAGVRHHNSHTAPDGLGWLPERTGADDDAPWPLVERLLGVLEEIDQYGHQLCRARAERREATEHLAVQTLTCRQAGLEGRPCRIEGARQIGDAAAEMAAAVRMQGIRPAGEKRGRVGNGKIEGAEQ